MAFAGAATPCCSLVILPYCPRAFLLPSCLPTRALTLNDSRSTRTSVSAHFHRSACSRCPAHAPTAPRACSNSARPSRSLRRPTPSITLAWPPRLTSALPPHAAQRAGRECRPQRPHHPHPQRCPSTSPTGALQHSQSKRRHDQPPQTPPRGATSSHRQRRCRHRQSCWRCRSHQQRSRWPCRLRTSRRRMGRRCWMRAVAIQPPYLRPDAGRLTRRSRLGRHRLCQSRAWWSRHGWQDPHVGATRVPRPPLRPVRRRAARRLTSPTAGGSR